MRKPCFRPVGLALPGRGGTASQTIQARTKILLAEIGQPIRRAEQGLTFCHAHESRWHERPLRRPAGCLEGPVAFRGTEFLGFPAPTGGEPVMHCSRGPSASLFLHDHGPIWIRGSPDLRLPAAWDRGRVTPCAQVPDLSGPCRRKTARPATAFARSLTLPRAAQSPPPSGGGGEQDGKAGGEQEHQGLVGEPKS